MKISGKFNLNMLMFDGLSLPLSAEGNAPKVEKDAEGVPVAWQLFHVGDNELTRLGEDVTLTLSAEDLDAIAAYYKHKGVKIPIDSRHFVYQFAQAKGVDESDVLNLLPNGRGTLGFGAIQRRADSIWLSDVEFKPLSRELMKEGVWRYHSPAIRGLLDGRLRITSVALENEPSINNLDAIAASSEDADIPNLTAGNTRKETRMKKLLVAIAGLLGMDSIALGADNDADDSIIGKISAVKAQMAASSAFYGKVRDSLALGADAQPETVHAALQGLIAKGQAHDSLKAQRDSLALAAENDKRERLIAKGKAEGKLSEGLIPWAQTQDSAALSAYLDNAPVVVPVGQIQRDGLKPAGDSIALTAEDRQVCRAAGISEEDFLKAKRG